MMRTLNLLPLILLSFFCSCQNKEKGASAVSETASVLTDSLCLSWDSIPADKDDVFTCTSEDGTMKFYSWNTGLGGTCPDYAVICQFRTKEGKVTTVDMHEKEFMPAWVSAVHSIKKDDGSTYYITTRSHRASSDDGYMWMDAFMIDHDTLKPVGVYDAGDNLDEPDLNINYSISDWFFTTNGEGGDCLFAYDAHNRNLYIPQIVYVDETSPIISDRYRVCHFDGKKFVDQGVFAHRGLHKSLANYNRLAKYFRTKSHLVRVDWLDQEGTLRYASWKSPSDMSRLPDLVIQGGTYDEEENTYTFTNDGYVYVVGYSEDKPVSEGVYEHREFLLVKMNGNVVLKEERVNPFEE